MGGYHKPAGILPAKMHFNARIQAFGRAVSSIFDFVKSN